MRIPSRRMLALRESTTGLPCAIILLLLFVGLVHLGLFFPHLAAWVAVGAVVLAVVIWSLEARSRWHFSLMMAGRENESICTFARSLDYRALDTWIIRAVYEGLQTYLERTQPAFPVRVTDLLETDLRIDTEAVDELADEIAARARRNMRNTKGNPLLGKVKTVSDLIQFLHHQPALPKTRRDA